jgi:hypothetical protein
MCVSPNLYRLEACKALAYGNHSFFVQSSAHWEAHGSYAYG